MVETTIRIDTEILNSIENYVKEISKYYKIDYIILFGSYAKGTNHEDSDIDIAVVSRDIKNRFNDGVKLISLTWGINTKIEPHPIKIEEFKENETPFIDEIINTGIELYAA
jgi:predicted nucleotidyltransferase